MSEREPTPRQLATAAGLPPPPPAPPRRPPSVAVGDILPGAGATPEIDAGYCRCGRPARIDQETCGYCSVLPAQADGVRWVGGKFDAALAQTDLLADYQRSLLDPNYVSVREYSALLDARMAELLTRLREAVKSHHWVEAATAWASFRNAEAMGETVEARKAALRLEAIFAQGEQDEMTWAQLMSAMELRRKMADTEARNAERLQNMLSTEQTMELISTLVTIAKKWITEPENIEGFARDVRAVVEGSGGRYHR